MLNLDIKLIWKNTLSSLSHDYRFMGSTCRGKSFFKIIMALKNRGALEKK